MRLSHLALLAALCTAPCMTHAQSAVLAGRVVEDSTSRPVAGAQIVKPPDEVLEAVAGSPYTDLT